MLLNLIQPNQKIITIVGMAKNSGKTVALNHLMEEAFEEDIPIGITSTGRDGESLDLVTETEKPQIYVGEGTLVATATELLNLGDANMEILRVTDFTTPLGNILIGRVRSSGYIQIAGPQSTKEIQEVSNMMLDLGAKFVIVDGALDRRSVAAPSISHGTILSTGAVLSRDMNKVIEETLHQINLFSLPRIEDERENIENLMDKNQIGIIDKNSNIEEINIKTALGSGHIIGSHLKDDSKYIVLPGSLVKSTLEGIINFNDKYKDIKIIVKDGTRIFINPRDWMRLQRYGVSVEVLHPINLIGITINPYSPKGYYFNPEEFLNRMRSYIKDIPVMDLVLGGGLDRVYG